MRCGHKQNELSERYVIANDFHTKLFQEKQRFMDRSSTLCLRMQSVVSGSLRQRSVTSTFLRDSSSHLSTNNERTSVQ